MPELPEVEVTRLGFADRIAGATVTAVRMGKPLRWPMGCDPQDVVGLQVLGVRRRGKYLLLDLSRGLLLVHLGMSGSLTFTPGWPSQLPPAGVHDHFDMVTTSGSLRLHDPRRFGAVVYSPSEATEPASKLLGGLGLEPLDPLGGFDADALYRGLQRRSAPVKQALLAGDIVVGVGNIYASEALFMARIRPTTRSSRISRVRTVRLHAAICEVLARAVQQGGSTLRDFSGADGKAGHFQLEAMVYGRAGEPCRMCTAPIQTIRQGQRSTFFCAVCQRP
jgi:formamidopyrimidine-DNA glycosylase